MPESPSILFMVAAFLLVLGPLVIAHELGHYLVGRWFGVKADVFSIGFGKELYGRVDKRGTRWRVAALPLGGFVQFAGDANAASIPDPDHIHEPGSFHAAPLWHRALIVLAGPVTNFLLALAIFASFNLYNGKPVAPSEVAAFSAQSDARAAGLQIGDRIVAVDGEAIESATDIAPHVSPYPGRTVTVAVQRGGVVRAIPVKLTPRAMSDQFGNSGVVADLGISYAIPIVDGFPTGSPAAASGIRENDRVLAVDGRKIESFDDIIATVSDKPGQTVSVDVRRGNDRLTFPVKLLSLDARDKDGRAVKLGRLGIATRVVELVPVGPIEAVTLAGDQCWGIVKMMVTGIAQIVSGERSVKELGGPIKIAKYSGEQLSLGWPQFVWFAALISINLGFINLLPIPTLDGGHLAFYAAEAVRRKPVGARGQEWAFRTGLAFVLALMLFVTFNDLASLNLFGR